MSHDLDTKFMDRALGLATRGEGRVEPNPMVGCVVVQAGKVVGAGWHEQFGGPHAEVIALQAAGKAARGSTLYVSLEPCCHQGKTPPCTEAILQAGVARVVAAVADPFPQVAGGGQQRLEEAGVACELGLLEDQAQQVLAPYLKLVTTGLPWVIAKWAMTLDGKMATPTGDSQWISNEESREVVHRLRGRVDAIVVGSGTALADDPLLTARPADPADVLRTPLRVVVDSAGKLTAQSKLAQTARETPLLVAVAADAPPENCRRLTDLGAEVFVCAGHSHAERLHALLVELGRRQLTNVLVEGGSRLLGTLFAERAVDEVHAFIAPRILGGATAPSPVGGSGPERMAAAIALQDVRSENLAGDLYLRGRVSREER